MMTTLYDSWLRELLEAPLPEETEATCQSCPMLEPDAGEASFGFDAQTKCCTFWPRLPSFLVGAALDADEGQAAELLARQLAAPGLASPLGLHRSPEYLRAYRLDEEAFGRDSSMQCPYHRRDDGGCGIWRHRPAVCATWFCKHVRGAAGWRLWDALRRLLSTVERDLSFHCALELGLPPAPLDALARARARDGEAGGRRPPSLFEEAWGSWLDRREEYFGRCAELVLPLSWKDVEGLAGPEVRLLRELLVERFAQLVGDEQVPDPLVPGQVVVAGLAPGVAQVTTYNAYDPIELPLRLLEVLALFDGRPNRVVLDAARRELGLEVDDELLRLLVDYDVLVRPGGPG